MSAFSVGRYKLNENYIESDWQANAHIHRIEIEIKRGGWIRFSILKLHSQWKKVARQKF